jgi:hypothetical protein
MANLKQIKALEAIIARKDEELMEQDRQVANLHRIANVAIQAMANMLRDLLPRQINGSHLSEEQQKCVDDATRISFVHGAPLHTEQPPKYHLNQEQCDKLNTLYAEHPERAQLPITPADE